MCKSRICRSVPAFLFAASAIVAQDKPITTALDVETDNVSVGEMENVISLVSSGLFQTKQHTAIDVSEREGIPKEVEFSRSDSSDESRVLEVGRPLSAAHVVVGRMGEVGTRHAVSERIRATASSRMVSTANGKYDEMAAVPDDPSRVASNLAGDEVGAAAATQSESLSVQPKVLAPRTPGPRRGSLSPARRIAAFGVLGAAAVCGVVGAVLYADATAYLKGPVADAASAYLGEPQGSTNYDTLYGAYLAQYSVFKGRMIPAVALIGSAVVCTVTSVVLFVPPTAKASGSAVSIAATVAPLPQGLRVGLCLRW